MIHERGTFNSHLIGKWIIAVAVFVSFIIILWTILN